MENLVIAVSVATIAASFLLLIFFLVLTLLRLGRCIQSLTELTCNFKVKAAEMEEEGVKFLKKTNEAADNLKGSLKSLSCHSKKSYDASDKIIDVLELAVMGLSLWNNIQKGRK